MSNLNVSSVTVSGAGVSAPILMTGQSLAALVSYGGDNMHATPRYQLQPTVFGVITGAASFWFEITSDIPDGTGAWPSPGNWVLWSDDPGPVSGGGSSSRAVPIKHMFTAIRVRSLPGSTGSVTLSVVQ